MRSTVKSFLSALPSANGFRAKSSTRFLASARSSRLLKDHTISDILVNRYDRVYIERAGKLELTGLSFKDNQHLMQIIERIVSRVGRRVDESSPMVDARLADGSRVNAIIPPWPSTDHASPSAVSDAIRSPPAR